MQRVWPSLSDREQKILVLLYGLADGYERTLEEVGTVFGLTKERIRQLHNEALLKLRGVANIEIDSEEKFRRKRLTSPNEHELTSNTLWGYKVEEPNPQDVRRWENSIGKTVQCTIPDVTAWENWAYRFYQKPGMSVEDIAKTMHIAPQKVEQLIRSYETKAQLSLVRAQLETLQ